MRSPFQEGFYLHGQGNGTDGASLVIGRIPVNVWNTVPTHVCVNSGHVLLSLMRGGRCESCKQQLLLLQLPVYQRPERERGVCTMLMSVSLQSCLSETVFIQGDFDINFLERPTSISGNNHVQTNCSFPKPL